MPELPGLDLLGEWRRLMDSVVASAASMGDRAEIPRQLLEPMRKQAELFERTIAVLREPTELAKVAAGLERTPKRNSRRKYADRTAPKKKK